MATFTRRRNGRGLLSVWHEGRYAMVISASPSHEGPPEAIAARRFALGLGLTNECNLACAFCFGDPTRVDRPSIEQVRSVIRSVPVRCVKLGSGEHSMHPDFGA